MSNSLSRTMEGMASVGVGAMPVMPPEYFHTAEATRLAAQVRDGNHSVKIISVSTRACLLARVTN